jgi:hypothetical protein
MNRIFLEKKQKPVIVMLKKDHQGSTRLRGVFVEIDYSVGPEYIIAGYWIRIPPTTLCGAEVPGSLIYIERASVAYLVFPEGDVK